MTITHADGSDGRAASDIEGVSTGGKDAALMVTAPEPLTKSLTGAEEAIVLAPLRIIVSLPDPPKN